MEAASRIQGILKMGIEAMSQDLDAVNLGHKKFSLQKIDEEDLTLLCETAAGIFQGEPSLLQITPPVTVIGDLHGQIFDLFQIFRLFDIPPATKYLFLGDLVDRGPFSIETVALVLTLKALYPNHVYVIRGNHEFENVSLSGGFFTEIINSYGTANLFPKFVSCFEYLPLAAQVGQVLCVHAGLSPEFHNVGQLMALKRPIQSYDTSLLTGVLWSDPSSEPTNFCASRRGTGFFFNYQPLRVFLDKNNLTTLVRGHECVDGIKTIWNNTLYTVFSASNYCGVTNNKAGVLVIAENCKLIPKILGPFRYIQRSEAFSSSKKGTIMVAMDASRRCSSIYATPSQQKMHKIPRLSRINGKICQSQSCNIIPKTQINPLDALK